MKKTNQLANLSERMLSKNALPRSLYAYLHHHQTLTKVFCELLHSTLGDGAKCCTVVRFEAGVLIVSVSNQTLVNHLLYLHDHLVDQLSAHNSFEGLMRIHFVYFDNTN